MYVNAYVCAQNRKAKTRLSVSFACVLMAFGLFMLPRIQYTHTHANTHTHRVPFGLGY